VGLAVAVAFARTGVPVIGCDIDGTRIEELRATSHDLEFCLPKWLQHVDPL
jgi:UDP-N-acetyl-D-mannosaminuronate dehydrogenase